MSEIRRRAWSLLTISEDRQYGGNTGYGDDPERVYRYDSEVANSRQVSKDDLVILRDRERILGAAIIDEIVPSSGLKNRLRCPECGTTDIKKRKKHTPVWRCNKGHEFDHAKEERVYRLQFRPSHHATTARRCRGTQYQPRFMRQSTAQAANARDSALRVLSGGEAVKSRCSGVAFRE